MCLQAVDKLYYKPCKKTYFGYKAFSYILGDWNFRFFDDIPLKLDSWNIDNNTEKIRAMDARFYSPGYHIYKNSSGIRNYYHQGYIGIFLVKFTDVVAKGMNRGTYKSGLYDCYVARKMLVIKHIR